MPISPENRARYPADSPVISLQIRKGRAGDRCECQGECGYDHGGRCPEINGQPHSVTTRPSHQPLRPIDPPRETISFVDGCLYAIAIAAAVLTVGRALVHWILQVLA